MGNWGIQNLILNNGSYFFDGSLSYFPYFNRHDSYNINTNVDVCVESLYHGIDWIYSFGKSTLKFNPNILYFTFLNSLYDD